MKKNYIPRHDVLDEKNNKIAVMLDIKTFDKIEEAIENYGLMQYIKENKNDKALRLAEAKLFYGKLSKSK